MDGSRREDSGARKARRATRIGRPRTRPVPCHIGPCPAGRPFVRAAIRGTVPIDDQRTRPASASASPSAVTPGSGPARGAAVRPAGGPAAPACHEADDHLAAYRDAIHRYGPGFDATLWGSREAQLLRFDVLADLVDLGGLRLVDVGCGAGDLAAHLRDRGIDLAGYVGIDALPEMIRHAEARGLPGTEWRTGDPLADPGLLDVDADMAYFSGTLNTLDDEAARRLVLAAWRRTSLGVCFNFLGDRPHPRWAGRRLDPARRFDVADWVAWALGLTSRVAFRQDYLDGHDATILVLHDGG